MSHVHEDGGSLAGNDASPTSSMVGPGGIAASRGAVRAASTSSTLFLCIGSASRRTHGCTMGARLHPEVMQSTVGACDLAKPPLTP
jgi:hypothetical protein